MEGRLFRQIDTFVVMQYLAFRRPDSIFILVLCISLPTSKQVPGYRVSVRKQNAYNMNACYTKI